MEQKAEQREFHTFLGLDLGGGKGRSTAVAILRQAVDGVKVVFVDTRAPSGNPFYDHELLRFLRENCAEALLAVNAPLLPTICLRCDLPRCPGLTRCPDPVAGWYRRQEKLAVVNRRGKPALTPYTQRACDILLQRRYHITPRETFGQGMGPLTARAHYLRRAMADCFELQRNLIEVYPKATLHALFDGEAAKNYKKQYNTWRTRAQILEALSEEMIFEVWREKCLSNDHCFDAVICAYTGYLWSKEGWEMPEEDREIFLADGWIWFPPHVPPAPEER